MRKSRAETRVSEKILRSIVWARDQGKCRCTGKPLLRQSDNWNELGDVAHIKPRSTHPELKFEASNCLLLCRTMHIASDGRGNYRLKILGDDARKKLRFVMTDKNGQILWEREG